ncbi:MAG: flagellar hook-basal body complex protein FliE [Candidatus Saganbacteria bacterium]|nr:flagellar hook-basal body complex protein FliE [Candidatus Saganbacteria bacterium]
MVEQINPINADLSLAQILGDDFLAQAPEVASPNLAAEPTSPMKLSRNPFDDILSKAIDSLNGISQSEFYANQLIDKYLHGQAELSDVMVAQSKMSIMVQLAVTTVNSAVTAFKEVIQMQI